MVKNNQNHLKKELQFYLMKSLFKKNKKKSYKKTSARIDAKSLNNARVEKINKKKENLKTQLQQNTEKMNAIEKQKLLIFVES